MIIATENLNITRAQVEKINSAFFGQNCPAIVSQKYVVYRAEIVNFLAKIAPDFKVNDSDSLLYLFGWAERIDRERGKAEQAAACAAAQSARTQLKAWDWPGLN